MNPLILKVAAAFLFFGIALNTIFFPIVENRAGIWAAVRKWDKGSRFAEVSSVHHRFGYTEILATQAPHSRLIAQNDPALVNRPSQRQRLYGNAYISEIVRRDFDQESLFTYEGIENFIVFEARSHIIALTDNPSNDLVLARINDKYAIVDANLLSDEHIKQIYP